MSADDQREQRFGGEWTLDQLADLAAGTGSWPDHLRTPVRKLAAQKAFPDLIAAARERDRLRATVERVGKLADEWAGQGNDLAEGTWKQIDDGRAIRRILGGDR